MRYFLTPETVPPQGGWIWTHPETGHEIRGGNAAMLLSNARDYCRVNNLPIGVGFDQRIIDSLCDKLPEICGNTEPPTISEMAASFARSAKQWIAGGAHTLSFEQYHQRLTTCQGCDRWNGEAFFGFGKCGKCGCSGVKLYMNTEKCPLNKWTV